MQDVLHNCKRITSMIDGAKRGYPGLDLIIFPEYRCVGSVRALLSLLGKADARRRWIRTGSSLCVGLGL